GFAENMEITALGFDYNTGRMYCVENKYVGGLGIIDLDTGAVDMLGHPTGDLYGGVYIPALCVTADGTIVISDAVMNLYTIDPDTLVTKMIYSGNGEPSSAFYEAMFYDHDTGSIYWNPCDGAGYSPLYLVRMPQNEWEQATVVDMGDVATKYGCQQTVMFSIPENEPETRHLPVESIEIVNGEALTGLEGGSLKLTTVTVPARPTVQTRTWTSSDESVVSVDRTGTMTYNGIGTATVTVSITNKDEATHGGPFTDSIEITVMESAGEFVAFLNSDEDGSQYYDFWLNGKDYDLRHTTVGESMISTYSLRTGVYYDGYFYAYNDKGQFMRINAKVPSDYKVLGSVNLDSTKYQVTGMAVDYNTGILYGLTMPSNYDFNTWAYEEHPGELVTIDMDTGLLTTIAEMDFSTPVFALACDKNGTLYAAGGSFDMYATESTIYTVDKETGALTPYTTISGGVFTGANYYGSMQYNTQMTYDFGTDRLYLNVTADDQYYANSYGVHMVQLGDEPVASYLDGISLDFGRGTIKNGKVYLGLLAFIPEADEIPAAPVNGIILNKNSGRVAVGGTAELIASVRPSNAADPSLTWTSSDETIATVDGNGVITGVSEGKVIITVQSNQTGISKTCAITVVELTGPQSTAYTVSATKDSLISFNPALPAQTAKVVTTMSGGTTIKAMTAGEGCVYFITDSNYSYYLYRYDILTQSTTVLGQLSLFSVPSGLGYDAKNGLIYVTNGFYLHQFELDKLDASGLNNYTNFIMDSDYCTLAGVQCIDGAVYTIGTDLYNSVPMLMKYSNKYLNDRSVVLSGFDVSVVDGATDFSYDPSSDLFYLADAGHNIYTMDWDGTVESVDILGNGIDINGFAIVPAAE
ncbi:MAG: Ig-like domain-containing protein, partial [Oscillospiraceae bacterium]|nr:Ig-like domain-containing protein [Oscillospiraceae bacterium]